MNGRQTILIVTELFPNDARPTIGTFVVDQLRELSKIFELVVLTVHPVSLPRSRTFRKRIERIVDGIRVISLRHLPPTLSILSLAGIISYHQVMARNRQRFAPAIEREARQLHRQYNIALIHGHETYVGDLAGPIGKVLGVPSVFTLHGLYDYHRHGFGPAVVDAAVEHLRNTDRLIAVSRVAAASYQRNGLDGSDFTIIPNAVTSHPSPVPSSRIPRSPGQLTLLSVGFFAPEKRFERSIRTLKSLHDGGHRHVQLVLVGKGEQSATLRGLVDQLGLGPAVRFLGEVPPADMPAIYAAADILVHPSIVESFSMTCLEAMSYGKPVVCTNVIGLTEHLHPGQDAIVIPPDDQAALDAAVLRLVGDAAERQRIGRAAQRTAATLSWDHVVEQVSRVYHELIAR